MARCGAEVVLHAQSSFAFPAGSVTIVARSMAPEIVSREEELALVRAFVGEARRGSAALVLEGDAGIGKSTLWSSRRARRDCTEAGKVRRSDVSAASPAP